jgi:hypothetical protein
MSYFVPGKPGLFKTKAEALAAAEVKDVPAPVADPVQKTVKREG